MTQAWELACGSRATKAAKVRARSLECRFAASGVELPQHRQQHCRASRKRGSGPQPTLLVIEVNHMGAGTCLDGPEDVVSTEHGDFLVVKPGMPVRVVTVKEHYVARTCEVSPKRHRIGLIIDDPHSA